MTWEDTSSTPSGTAVTWRDTSSTPSGTAVTWRDTSSTPSGTAVTWRDNSSTPSGTAVTWRDNSSTPSGTAVTWRDNSSTPSGTAVTWRDNSSTAREHSTQMPGDYDTRHAKTKTNSAVFQLTRQTSGKWKCKLPAKGDVMFRGQGAVRTCRVSMPQIISSRDDLPDRMTDTFVTQGEK